MSLNKTERTLLENIKSMLKDDTRLGLSDKDEEKDEAERGFEYLHNHIDDMFHVKAAELQHFGSITAAFAKVHDYKYIDDPEFETALSRDMTAQGVPADERQKAIDAVRAIIKELREESEWAEKDSGFNPDLDEIEDVSQPEQPLDFDEEDAEGHEDYFDGNMDEEEHGDASPGEPIDNDERE